MKEGAVTALRNNELLRELGDATISRIADVAAQRAYPGGARIFCEGDRADAVYGVISGRVQITANNAEGQEIILYQMESGGIFGLNSIIDGSPRAASARAATRSFVFIVSRENFLNLLARVPDLAVQLILLLCRRQQIATRMIVEEYSASKVATRLAHRLLEMAKTNGHAGDAAPTLCVTQADLAKCVFVSRQAVNNCLQDWEWRGLISASRGHVVITNMEALHEIARCGDTRRDVQVLRLLGVERTGGRKADPARSVRF
jgi:CRP-like cAMP-binding protein